jgi:glycine cleavage system aminomethyltransferase T
VSFRLEDPDAMMWGGELVLRDGFAVGQVTSAAWSDTLGTSVGLAYVWRRDRSPLDAAYVKAGSYAVNVGGRTLPASVTLRPLVDPANQKIRA